MNEPKKVEFPKVELGSEQVQRIADGLIGNTDRVWPEDFEASGGKNTTPSGGIDDLFQG
jgi:hypothetical protein